MAPPPLLSVVVPTRDEGANVGPLVARLSSTLAGIDHEILFVDNFDDGTPAAIAAAAVGGDSAHRACPSPGRRPRRGPEHGGGVRDPPTRGEFVCVMDADLQHPPEGIPAMLEAARAGADVVVASRYVRGGSRRGLDGTLRHLVSRAAGAVARALFSEARASTDPLSGCW